MTKLPHLLALALVGAAGAGPATADPASSSPAVLALLRQQAEAGEVRYAAADVDLNGDGQPEVVAYLMGPNICGSGGCSAVVLVRESGGWRVLTAMDVTQLPIRVLPSRSHGWRDLAVGVSGGGARAGAVRVRYDGERYGDNPTDADSMSWARVGGTQLIAEDDRGRPLP